MRGVELWIEAEIDRAKKLTIAHRDADNLEQRNAGSEWLIRERRAKHAWRKASADGSAHFTQVGHAPIQRTQSLIDRSPLWLLRSDSPMFERLPAPDSPHCEIFPSPLALLPSSEFGIKATFDVSANARH